MFNNFYEKKLKFCSKVNNELLLQKNKTMKNYKFQAVIFDLDGVITKTALVHSKAWAEMFNSFLKQYSNEQNVDFKPFTHEGDYLPYVDGKPRYKGVQDFLSSRKIELPYGNESDSAETLSVCGLGNKKNEVINQILQRDGVEVYPSTVQLLERLKTEGIRIGVASSSKNCQTVLNAAGLMHFFETRVDGEVSAELGLKGKPEPDIFTKAADNLGAEYSKCVVIEDAISGVQAGVAGNFGLVIGLAREDNELSLKENGAHVVVEDIADFDFDKIAEWFENANQ